LPVSTPLSDFSLARVLVAGDGEALHFGHALNGMAVHGARLVNS
jgi:hypothetical protein